MFQLSLTGKPFLLLNPLILALVILSICKSLDEIEMSTLLLIDGLLYINSQDIQDNSGIKLLPAAVVQPNNNKAKKTMRQVIVIGVNSKGAQSLTFGTFLDPKGLCSNGDTILLSASLVLITSRSLSPAKRSVSVAPLVPPGSQSMSCSISFNSHPRRIVCLSCKLNARGVPLISLMIHFFKSYC
ncbi:hypothetical protein G6F46_004719 [Rhizopus delemar]|uniref:Uncharacterized protein n=2 Tax=Rhizopus TaxID=4842 RepID=A0A9P7CR00_9FUNG|nr:hypothetical protein G6F36_012162 [Rhizopus arrhizus]KAG1455851.1 hypothetical protein G6F55_006834 [Rhizopus delemar]KAG1499302.1 hypothetical protein G6F54_004494 [Rhizopus delemar]KAG1509054.1 hypothetical protein G6F53_007734 [Rhizopus delemar]KAG1527666.1 hypothetical protein G6F52_001331 [Rhizopus delemar]